MGRWKDGHSEFNSSRIYNSIYILTSFRCYRQPREIKCPPLLVTTKLALFCCIFHFCDHLRWCSNDFDKNDQLELVKGQRNAGVHFDFQIAIQKEVKSAYLSGQLTSPFFTPNDQGIFIAKTVQFVQQCDIMSRLIETGGCKYLVCGQTY